MKITVHIVRSLLALVFLWGAIAFFFQLMQPKEVPSKEVMAYMTGITSVNLMYVVKSLELICGVLLLINAFAPLANLVLLPISINILLFHIYLSPKELPICLAIILFQLFLLYAYRKNYAGLLVAKPIK